MMVVMLRITATLKTLCVLNIYWIRACDKSECIILLFRKEALHCPRITEKKAEVRNEDDIFHCTPSTWQQRSWTRLTRAESEHSPTVLAMGDNPLTNSVIRLKLIQTLFSDIRGGEMAHVVSPLCPATGTLLSHPK